jgi:hypothetical protein
MVISEVNQLTVYIPSNSSFTEHLIYISNAELPVVTHLQ